MRISSLISKITNKIEQKLKYEFAMGRQVNKREYEVTCHINTGYDED